MITTCLFDLDGTLLPMDQDVFVKSYLSRLAVKMAPYGYNPERLVNAIWKGTAAMVGNDGTQSNADAFWNCFMSIFGPGARGDERVFETFYHGEFQLVQDDCGYNPQAAQCIQEIKKMGLRAVLATNPIFPAVATNSRIRWAGLAPSDFELVTTYENSGHCKPNPDYYREILGKLNLKPEECLMVGNDVDEDMIAEQLGMRVFLMTDCLINKQDSDISRYPQGSFPELLEFIRGL